VNKRNAVDCFGYNGDTGSSDLTEAVPVNVRGLKRFLGIREQKRKTMTEANASVCLFQVIPACLTQHVASLRRVKSRHVTLCHVASCRAVCPNVSFYILSIQN